MGQPVSELSSDNKCTRATMALIMALDKAETQNKLDSLDQVVDSLWYLLTNVLSVISLHSQWCNGMAVGLVLHCSNFDFYLAQ